MATKNQHGATARIFLMCLLIVSVMEVTVHGQICTNGWKLYKDTYIFADLTRRKYDGAREHCWNIGGSDLLMPKTTEENEFLGHISCGPPLDRYRFWIGMTDREQENSFMWLDNTYNSLDDWAPKEPNNLFEQDCVAFITSPNANLHGKWSADNCGVKLFSLCSKPMELPSLKNKPERVDIGPTYALVTWHSWNDRSDVGDGPVTGYMIDIRRGGGGEWRNVGFVPVKAVFSESRWHSFDMNVDIADEFGIDTSLQFNVTGLTAETDYEVAIALLHGDSGKIGDLSPPLAITTPSIPYRLPSLGSPPTLKVIGSSCATVGWKAWQDRVDHGTGPVAAYLVNVRPKPADGRSSSVWINVGAVPAGTAEEAAAAAEEGMTFHVTHLQPGRVYEIMVSLVHGTLGREGPDSPALDVTTLTLDESTQGPNGSRDVEGDGIGTTEEPCNCSGIAVDLDEETHGVIIIVNYENHLLHLQLHKRVVRILLTASGLFAVLCLFGCLFAVLRRPCRKRRVKLSANRTIDEDKQGLLVAHGEPPPYDEHVTKCGKAELNLPY